MSELKDIMNEIEEFRKIMNEAMEENDDMLHKEVIAASQMLDAVLNEYYKILSKNIEDE